MVELTGGGSVAETVGVSDMWQVTGASVSGMRELSGFIVEKFNEEDLASLRKTTASKRLEIYEQNVFLLTDNTFCIEALVKYPLLDAIFYVLLFLCP